MLMEASISGSTRPPALAARCSVPGASRNPPRSHLSDGGRQSADSGHGGYRRACRRAGFVGRRRKRRRGAGRVAVRRGGCRGGSCRWARRDVLACGGWRVRRWPVAWAVAVTGGVSRSKARMYRVRIASYLPLTVASRDRVRCTCSLRSGHVACRSPRAPAAARSAQRRGAVHGVRSDKPHTILDTGPGWEATAGYRRRTGVSTPRRRSVTAV